MNLSLDNVTYTFDFDINFQPSSRKDVHHRRKLIHSLYYGTVMAEFAAGVGINVTSSILFENLLKPLLTKGIDWLSEKVCDEYR